MVQQSLSSQERFIEEYGRNHAEMMFVTERNHFEMMRVFNSTLQTLADVGRDFLNRNAT